MVLMALDGVPGYRTPFYFLGFTLKGFFFLFLWPLLFAKFGLYFLLVMTP